MSSNINLFWSKVNKGKIDECWNWTGYVHPNGYGRTEFNGEKQATHRIVFFLTYNYWPILIRHKCDNRICCNPNHLIESTQKENMIDASTKGRLLGNKSQYRINQVDIDSKQLAELRKTKTYEELSEIFICSTTTIKRKLRKIKDI